MFLPFYNITSLLWSMWLFSDDPSLWLFSGWVNKYLAPDHIFVYFEQGI